MGRFNINTEKSMKVNKDTQLHMVTVHRRRGRKKPVENAFNLVISGLMISATLISSITFTGCGCGAKKPPTKGTIEKRVDKGVEYKEALITNLKMATKLIEGAVKSGQWDVGVLNKMCERLNQIEARLNLDTELKDDTNLLHAIMEADKTVSGIEFDFTDKRYKDLVAKRLEVENKLMSVKKKTKIAKDIGHTENVLLISLVRDAKSIKEGMANKSLCTSIFETLTRDVSHTLTYVKELPDKKNTSNNIVNALVELDNLVKSSEGTLSKGDILSSAQNSRKEIEKVFEFLGIAKNNPAKDTSDATTAKLKAISGGSGGSSGGSLSASNHVSSIKTRYGDHTYGCKTQAEYDAVMRAVDAKVARIKSGKASVNKYAMMFMDGKRKEDFPRDSQDYAFMADIEKSRGLFLVNVDKNTAYKILAAGGAGAELRSGAANPGDGSPRSAYDAIVRKRVDCDAAAHVDSAVLDALGYSTTVRHAVGSNGIGHAWGLVKIKGYWWAISGLKPVGMSGSAVSNPTY